MGNNGKTKQLVCTVCSEVFTGSLFASPKTAKCTMCKKVKKKVGEGNPVIHDGKVDKLPTVITTTPVSVRLVRNRSVIEAEVIMDTGEQIERVPTSWKVVKNELDYLSISKISTYQQCPYKFKEIYMTHDGVDDDDNGNVYTWFGTILHEVMDRSTKAWEDNGIKINPLVLYDEAWRENQLSDLTMYKEGRDLILEWFRIHPIGSLPYKTLSTEFEWRGKLSEIMENVPKELENMYFGCQFDYVGELDETTAILKDYKSNRRPYTAVDLEDSLQLQMYEIILRKVYPQYTNWITGYELFRFGWQQCGERSVEDLEAIKSFVINIGMQIVNDTKFDQTLNGLCGYCNLRHKCKRYCDFVNDPKREIDTIKVDTTDMVAVNEAREQFGTLERIVKGRKDELSAIVKIEVENSVVKGEKLVIDGKELYLQAQSRPTYNYYSVRDVMAVQGKAGLLESCITINKTKLDKIAKEDPQLAMMLTQCTVEGFSAPYLLQRKAKK